MMRVYTFDHPERVTESELRLRLELLPMDRLGKAMRYRNLIDRVLCAESFLLLGKGLNETYGLSPVPEFGYEEHGKPFLLSYPGIHFSISHCRNGAACAISDRSVGVDIETVPPVPDRDLCEVCFNGDERRIIESSPDPGIQFARLWTCKEAYLKLTGEGIVDDMPGVLRPEVLRKVMFSTVLRPDLGYVLTTAVFKA